jgi:RHS repeat-associated protein
MEDASGLVYMNARYYDPSTGMFISPDTIIPDPSNVLDYNRYAYGRGNPVKYNDPSGHFPHTDSRMLNLPMEIGGGGGGGAVTIAFIAGVAYMVVADEVTGLVEHFPMYPQQPLITSFPLPTSESQTGIPGFYDNSANNSGSTIWADPPFTHGPTDHILTAGGQQPNDIGAWAAQQVGAQLPVEIGQFEVEINGQTRYYDGQFTETGRFVEVKGGAGLSKKSFGISSRIRDEIGFDSHLAVPPVWVFVGKLPSSGLTQLLDDNGIPWSVVDPLEPYGGGN